ncbi:MAG TPA: Type 1 glutamine amidotransferase-like domain-containing protein [Dehalococcoidales bacterium]|nr:Type 1 glutamine amidotransferase-like domain-containing protein [Dehalococcoidales bacterium]
MKFYLSSFKLGNNPKELARMMAPGKEIGYIPNACDYSNVDPDRTKEGTNNDIAGLSNLGLSVQLLDLREYFGKKKKLKNKIAGLSAVFLRGGNTFILRQAMRASGFDEIFKELLKRKDFVYAGYSAGIAVLAHDLNAVQLVDNPMDKPYKEIRETIWEGLGYLDYLILPHYKSNHPESPAIDKMVEHCLTNSITFRTLKDGEVIIIE